jgi:hypothetical protein
MFSVTLGRVLDLAEREAQERRHAHLTLEHLLFAIAHDPEGENILRACGVDLDRLRKDLSSTLDEMERLPRGREQEPSHTLAFRRVLQAAQVAVLTGVAVQAGIPVERIAFHFHDTRGTALANVAEGLREGVRIFDSSAGGLGGCPYAPGASGNLATEDLLYMLHGMGIETGVNLPAVAQASRSLAPRVGHALPSRYLQASSAEGA